MSDHLIIITLSVGAVLVWTLCCVTAGLIWSEHERKKEKQ